MLDGAGSDGIVEVNGTGECGTNDQMYLILTKTHLSNILSIKHHHELTNLA